MTLKFSGGYAKLQRCMQQWWCPKLVGNGWDSYVSGTKGRSEGRIGAGFHCICAKAPHRDISRPRVVRTTSKPVSG
jgi:hypothetical protein